MRVLPVSLFFLALCCQAADGPDNSADIQQQVAEFLYQEASSIGGDVQIDVSRPDSALGLLPPCESELQMQLRQPIARHRHSVQVRCESPAWAIYIPATVSIKREVVVSLHPLTRKQVVSANDLTLAMQDITLLNGDFMTDVDESNGMVIRRAIDAGSTITRDMLEQPEVIRKGDSVSITAGNSQIQVSSSGTAMENGRIGEQISVKNQQSGRIIKAVASSAGRVEIAL